MNMGSEQRMTKVVVVGGGLVGGLCACVLAKKQYYDIEVFESRPDPRCAVEGSKDKGRSINLALSARGRAALAQAGLEDVVLSQAIPMKGRMIHSKNGELKPIIYDPVNAQCIYSVSRRFLNELLITEAEKLSNVKINFSHKLVESNLEKGHLSFELMNGNRNNNNVGFKSTSADLVIGADGAHSALRQSMLKKPMTNFSQTYIDHGYMELCIPSTATGEHNMQKNYLHIWPRNEFMLIALPNLDGSFTVTLFMPFKKFEELDNSNAVIDFFNQEFPDVVDLIGEKTLVRDFLMSKPSHLISIKCDPLNYGKGLLIGDAAHAMVPFYGQGMNAGFEDVLLLDKLLPDDYNIDNMWEIIEKFSRERTPDAHAICELALYNYLEMRCLVNQSGFIIRRYLDYKFHSWFGHAWTPLYNNVTFSLTPYAKCIEQKRNQDRVIMKAKNVAFLSLGVATIGTGFLCKNIIQRYISHVAQLLYNVFSH